MHVFIPERIEANIKNIQKAFGSRFKDFSLAYSFKTNCHQLVISEVRKSKIMAEVVSREEYESAIANGFLNSEIIFNGVCKEKFCMIECCRGKGIVNIDNEEEVQWAEEHYDSTGEILSLGIRLNFNIGNGIKSRFGVEPDSAVYKRIKELEAQGKIKVIGLSCHFTNTRESSYWKKKAEMLSKCSADFPSIEFLDFGGSLAADYEKEDSRKNDGKGKMDFETAAKSIYEELKKAKLEDKRIIIESGTAVVGSAFKTIAKVVHIKDNGFVVLDISFLDLLLPSLRDNIQFEVIHKSRQPKMLSNYTIAGYTCLENDIIKKGFNGKLGVGDEIVFKNTGAYTMCFSNSFIKNPLDIVGNI
ncbi:MAG: alanine racemase [Treponema sp.]|nr:alanine racemase [Candidatus Treponema equifaecale]